MTNLTLSVLILFVIAWGLTLILARQEYRRNKGKDKPPVVPPDLRFWDKQMYDAKQNVN